jgi:hypothetical protein
MDGPDSDREVFETSQTTVRQSLTKTDSGETFQTWMINEPGVDPIPPSLPGGNGSKSTKSKPKAKPKWRQGYCRECHKRKATVVCGNDCGAELCDHCDGDKHFKNCPESGNEDEANFTTVTVPVAPQPKKKSTFEDSDRTCPECGTSTRVQTLHRHQYDVEEKIWTCNRCPWQDRRFTQSDLNKWVKKIRNLPVFANLLRQREKTLKMVRGKGFRVKFAYFQKSYMRRAGFYRSDGTIKVNISSQYKVSDVLEILLHEFTHASGIMNHKREFKDRLLLASNQLLDLAIPVKKASLSNPKLNDLIRKCIEQGKWTQSVEKTVGLRQLNKNNKFIFIG